METCRHHAVCDVLRAHAGGFPLAQPRARVHRKGGEASVTTAEATEVAPTSLCVAIQPPWGEDPALPGMVSAGSGSDRDRDRDRIRIRIGIEAGLCPSAPHRSLRHRRLEKDTSSPGWPLGGAVGKNGGRRWARRRWQDT